MARNPPWHAEELLLALDVYFRFPEARQSKSHPEVAKLSEVLRALSLPIERPDPEKFRNVNGVFLKLQNLKALDPEYTADGRVGMTAGATSREQALWDRYADNQDELHELAERLRADASSRTATSRPLAHAADEPPDAHVLLAGLVGRTIPTAFRAEPNTVLDVDENNVLVGTSMSPAGSPVPIRLVQEAIDRLIREGELEISVKSLGHRRSSFVGAVLLTLPGARAVTLPPRIVLDMEVVSDYRATVAGEVNAWWEGDRGEIYWLEITDRSDIGVDLHAPQRDARGMRSPGYSLIWWIAPGDIVFHYDRNEQTIVAWSSAVGQVEEAPVVWLPHRAATRRRIGIATARPGWWLDLDGPYPLSRPLTLGDLRSRGEDVRGALEELRALHGGSLYFPFFFYRGTELRPMQPYLNKLPAAVVRVLPELAEAAATAVTSFTSGRTTTGGLGSNYRVATVNSLPSVRDPFTVDPAVVERGLKGHADTQNALAAAIEAAGCVPRSAQPGEPNFDIAWEQNGVIYVAEVKSLTDLNEERQLRLGLGQVLRYRDLMRGQRDSAICAVLVPERIPRDPSWNRLCDELGVILATAPGFESLDL